jgi:hypothetical protein
MSLRAALVIWLFLGAMGGLFVGPAIERMIDEWRHGERNEQLQEEKEKEKEALVRALLEQCNSCVGPPAMSPAEIAEIERKWGEVVERLREQPQSSGSAEDGT